MAKIGIFDSGVGGLSVLKEAIKFLPKSDYYYFGDNANCPYGPKGPDFIRNRSFEITKFLIDTYGVDIVVVACNTASSYAVSFLREQFNIPFIAMVPAVKPAVATTHTGIVGVLATKGTLNAPLYKQIRSIYGSNASIIEHIGEGFVELVENLELDSVNAQNIVEHSIRDMVLGGADKIVLGCSHYPFLIDTISSVANRIKPLTTTDIEIIDPAPAVARHLKDVIIENGLGDSDYQVTLLSSGDDTILRRLYKSFAE